MVSAWLSILAFLLSMGFGETHSFVSSFRKWDISRNCGLNERKLKHLA